jgi:type IV pilus assembly protein PilO
VNSDKIKEILSRIPIGTLALLYAGYLGYDYWSFTHDESSPLLQKQSQIESAKTDNAKLQVKVKQGQDFLKSLEAKKAELRKLAGDLEAMKGTLPEALDVPEFMKTTLTEARKVGLTVVSLKPTEGKNFEFYAEQPFEFAFRGVYVQLMVFLERMANIQRIARVDDFDIKPLSPGASRYVELEGTVNIRAYRYLNSKADELARERAKDAASSAIPKPMPPKEHG